MKTIFITIFLLLSWISPRAQTTSWLWAKSGDCDGEGMTSLIAADASGNVFVAGCYYGSAEIDINNLPPGVYIVKMTDVYGVTGIKKVVKE